MSGALPNQVPSSRVQYINPDRTPTRALYYFLSNIGTLVNSIQTTVATLVTTVAGLSSLGRLLTSSVPVGSAVVLTSVTPADITSILLPAGRWNVYGSMFLTSSGSPPITNWKGWINTASVTAPTNPGTGALFILNLLSTALTTNSAQGLPVGTTNILSDGTVTAFLSGQAGFSSGAVSAYGFLGATLISST